MGTNLRATTLADVLFGKIRGRILGRLFGHPDRKFFFQELRREIGSAGVGAVQRELKTLIDAGIITRENAGHQVFYSLNRTHPLYSDLRSLIAKTVGTLGVIRTALRPLEPKIAFAFVYGSVAKGTEATTSDVDLMVVGDVKLEEVLEELSAAERTLGRTINPTTYSVSEFRSKIARRNHFLSSVMKGPKVLVIGDEGELRRLT